MQNVPELIVYIVFIPFPRPADVSYHQQRFFTI